MNSAMKWERERRGDNAKHCWHDRDQWKCMLSPKDSQRATTESEYGQGPVEAARAYKKLRILSEVPCRTQNSRGHAS